MNVRISDCCDRHRSGGGCGFGLALLGKWFVFWSVGIRLLAAGLSQVFSLAYTAEYILGLRNAESHIVIRELGFATTAIGIVATASIAAPCWIMPMAIVGATFYGLAVLLHVRSRDCNRLENVAMVSDLFIAIALTQVCTLTTVRG